jgi:photosystem II stability/assembly factor-like uncharacterized protein
MIPIVKKINDELSIFFDTDDAEYRALIADKDGDILSGGTIWTQRTSSFGSTFINSVAHNQTDLWVAVGYSGKLATSPDGKTWTQQTSSFGSTKINDIAHNGTNLWVAVGESGKLATSPDGETWTQRTSSFGTTGINGVYHNKKYLWVAVGDSGKLATSPDGINWTQQASGFGSSYILCVSYNEIDLWVAAGTEGKLATSPDGIAWTQRTSGFGTSYIDSVAHNRDDLWVAVGQSGKLATSPDGIAWTQQASSFGGALIHKVAHNGINLWVAVGNDKKLATSPDGIAWTQRDNTFFGDILGVAHDSFNLLVAVASFGELATSPDGITKPTNIEVGAFAGMLEYFRTFSKSMIDQLYIDKAVPEFLKYQLENFFESYKYIEETNSAWIDRTFSIVFEHKISNASIIYNLRPYSSQEPVISNANSSACFCDFSYCNIYIEEVIDDGGETVFIFPAILSSFSGILFTFKVTLYDTSPDDIEKVKFILDRFIAAGISYVIEVIET